jgi:hypothetical protein
MSLPDAAPNHGSSELSYFRFECSLKVTASILQFSTDRCAALLLVAVRTESTWFSFLLAYFVKDGSIARAANRLRFIHHNMKLTR